MRKLIAIDGNSLMYRAYYALPSMMAKSGMPTGAVYGFISMLLKLLKYDPDYLVVAFDSHGPTFRHEHFKEYKAGRKPTPEDLKPQFPIIKEILSTMGIATCQCQTYEADDIIGTFGRIASEHDTESLLVTGDRDALQLINPYIHVLLTKKGISETIEYDESTLMEQYGLKPYQMLDLKGLMGDSSDNLPGIPGVGEKTALTLLQKYGTLESALENADSEKGALKEKLSNGAESARLSYQMGTINSDVPVMMTLDDCAFRPEKMSNAIQLMGQLELRSLIARLPKGEKTAERKQNKSASLTIVKTAEELNMLLETLKKSDLLAFDFSDDFTIATGPENIYRISVEATLFEPALEPNEVLLILKPILESDKHKKLVFDAKKIAHMLKKQNIELRGVCFDAMIADYLLNAIGSSTTLEGLCAERYNAPPDAGQLFSLYKDMLCEIDGKKMRRLYDEIEFPLIKVLFDMEDTGFLLDIEFLENIGREQKARLNEIAQQIYKYAGGEFNILSTKQLGGILFDTLGLPAQRKNKSGYSTDADVLEKLIPYHPIVKPVIEFRFLSKLNSTFIEGLIKAADEDNRVHTTFNQTVTATGRVSSTEPNLQNIPVRTEIGREIRKAFIASDGNLLVGADYSQIELRLLAHMSGDECLINAFNRNDDIHAITASEVFNIPLDKITSKERSAAKAVNFGIIYGISDFGLANNLGIPVKQASEYIRLYFARYPRVKEYLDSIVELAKQNGYAETLMGRRRELPELKSQNYNIRSFGERVAMNMPIQGTAADIIKGAMVNVHKMLGENKMNSKLILQIHDELIIDSPLSEVENAKEILRRGMQNVIELKVPLLVEVKAGHSWFET